MSERSIHLPFQGNSHKSHTEWDYQNKTRQYFSSWNVKNVGGIHSSKLFFSCPSYGDCRVRDLKSCIHFLKIFLSIQKYVFSMNGSGGRGMRIVCYSCRRALRVGRPPISTAQRIWTYQLYSTKSESDGELGNSYVPRKLSPSDLTSLAKRCTFALE